MKLAGIVRDSIVDGEGIRDVIFFQGCKHRCEGCHNPTTWNWNGGNEVDETDVVKELSDSSNDITISGGDPMLQFPSLLRMLHSITTTSTKRVWIYTGYTFEEIPMAMWHMLTHYAVDVVVDGRYEKDKRDTSLAFRGSSNQRLIDLKKSVLSESVVLWEGYNE